LFASLSLSEFLLQNSVEEIANKRGVPMAQIAIAWIMAKGVAAPIIGMTSINKIKDAVEATKIKLTPEEVAYLEASYVPRAVIGH
jgi:aryl-alcohol dehydrogenase-like predicted oxidoreductase